MHACIKIAQHLHSSQETVELSQKSTDMYLVVSMETDVEPWSFLDTVFSFHSESSSEMVNTELLV